MKLFRNILISLVILLSCSCDKTGEFEPMPDLNPDEFREAISGTWELNCIGMHTEATGNSAEKVVALDTMISAINDITYKVNGRDYQITISFNGEIEIEQSVIQDGKRKTSRISADRYVMNSSSPDTFPLEFERDDNGNEVFRTLSVHEGNVIHEHSYNYPTRYFGKDRISSFEIGWFILQSDHLYYQFIRKRD